MMKTKIKIIISILIILIIIIINLFINNQYSDWIITNKLSSKSNISWAKFEWTNDTLSGKYFERTSMNIPCHIEGISNPVTFQFDLGSNLTGLYEKNLLSIINSNLFLKNKLKSLKSNLQFWNKNKCIENLKIQFGNYEVTNKKVFIYKNTGEILGAYRPFDTIHLGSIGVDLFKNKILIIDYPNQKFAICNNIPKEYNNNLIDIELNSFSKVILPMKLHNNSYKIMFDNGSSIFPLLTGQGHISNFSNLPDIDTIQIKSWGHTQNITSKMIPASFKLAGKTFSKVKVYINNNDFNTDKDIDGITGNALFWNNIILIDFQNKKFGIK